MIDLDALDTSIAESEKKNFFVAPIVKELIAELRHARGERAAVVALLRKEARRMQEMHGARYAAVALRHFADLFERGEHRREENGHTYPSADAKKTTKRGEHRREEE